MRLIHLAGYGGRIPLVHTCCARSCAPQACCGRRRPCSRRSRESAPARRADEDASPPFRLKALAPGLTAWWPRCALKRGPAVLPRTSPLRRAAAVAGSNRYRTSVIWHIPLRTSRDPPRSRATPEYAVFGAARIRSCLEPRPRRHHTQLGAPRRRRFLHNAVDVDAFRADRRARHPRATSSASAARPLLVHCAGLVRKARRFEMLAAPALSYENLAGVTWRRVTRARWGLGWGSRGLTVWNRPTRCSRCLLRRRVVAPSRASTPSRCASRLERNRRRGQRIPGTRPSARTPPCVITPLDQTRCRRVRTSEREPHCRRGSLAGHAWLARTSACSVAEAMFDRYARRPLAVSPTTCSGRHPHRGAPLARKPGG